MAVEAPAPVRPGLAVPEGSGPRLPTAVLVAAASILVVNVVVLLLGTAAVGVSWDEPIHVERLQSFLTTGWYLPELQLDGSQPAADARGIAVYAPVPALLAHAVAVVLGSEEWETVTTTAEAYAHRHVLVALLGTLCLGAVATTVRLLLRSWRWGVLGAAVLSALPVWTGHAMFNIKDVPVATGYTLVTCGSVALVSTRITASRRRQVVVVAGLGAGAVLAVGTRPGTVVAIGASVVLALAGGWWLDARPGDGTASTARRLTLAGGALVGAWLVLLAVYPALFARPDLLVAAVLDSGEYPWQGEILTAGELMSMPPSPGYLPAWFAAQTPLVVLALALVGLGAPAWILRRARRGEAPAEGDLGAGLALVGAQALLLPAVAVATSAVLYDATRQVLFVQPALAVAATAAAWLVARRIGGRPAWRRGFYAVVVVGLVVPTATHVRLFPYDYVWFNVAAASRPIDGRWMTEYWRVSARELVAHTPEGGFPSCRLWTPTALLVSCEVQPQFAPYWDTRGEQIDPEPLGPGEYFVSLINRFGTTVPEGCTAVHEVTRPLFGQDVLMSAVSRCRVPVQPYPVGGISAADGGGVGYFVTGWVDPAADPVRSYWVPATVAFALPERLRGDDLRVRVWVRPADPATEGATALVRVNDVPVAEVELAADPSGPLVVDVPAAAAAALSDGRVHLELALQVPGPGGDARLVPSAVSRVVVRPVR